MHNYPLPLCSGRFTFFSAGSDNCTTCSGSRRETTNRSVRVWLICTFLLNHRSSSWPRLTGVDSNVTHLPFLSCLRSCWVLLQLFPGSKTLSVPPSHRCLLSPHNFSCKWRNLHLQNTLCRASAASECNLGSTHLFFCITQASTLSSGNQSPCCSSKELLSKTFGLVHLSNLLLFPPDLSLQINCNRSL